VIVGPVRLTAHNSTATAAFEIYEENGTLVCGLLDLKGRFKLPPKQWLRMVRAEMTKLEGIARDAGCAEMRIAD
jgi:hypothetical protein